MLHILNFLLQLHLQLQLQIHLNFQLYLQLQIKLQFKLQLKLKLVSDKLEWSGKMKTTLPKKEIALPIAHRTNIGYMFTLQHFLIRLSLPNVISIDGL